MVQWSNQRGSLLECLTTICPPNEVLEKRVLHESLDGYGGETSCCEGLYRIFKGSPDENTKEPFRLLDVTIFFQIVNKGSRQVSLFLKAIQLFVNKIW